MKYKLFSPLVFGLLLLAAAAPSLAQAKDNKPLFALPENATLEQTQEWLTRAITQNSAFSAKEGQVSDALDRTKKTDEISNSKVSELKFAGCVISYRIEKSYTMPKNDRMSTSPFPSVARHSSVKVKFDLKDINTGEITQNPTGEDSLYSVVSLRTSDYKRSIELADSEEGKVKVSAATVVVGGNVAENVRKAFVHIVKLCQAAP